MGLGERLGAMAAYVCSLEDILMCVYVMVDGGSRVRATAAGLHDEIKSVVPPEGSQPLVGPGNLP